MACPVTNDAASEGVSEREGKQTQQFLATLKDLAHRGPAILILDNTAILNLDFSGFNVAKVYLCD